MSSFTTEDGVVIECDDDESPPAVDAGFETAHYKLVIETGFWDSPCQGYPVYKLVNKENGMVEGEGIALPVSVYALMTAEQQYVNMIEEFASFAPTLPSFGE